MASARPGLKPEVALERLGEPNSGRRAVSAGGTIANLLAGALALALLRRPRFTAQLHYFVWLFAAVNLYVGTGYFLFSGVSNIGDWANFIVELPFTWLWRGLLVLLGGSSYYFCVRVMLARAVPLTGGDPAVAPPKVTVQEFLVFATAKNAASPWMAALRICWRVNHAFGRANAKWRM